MLARCPPPPLGRKYHDNLYKRWLEQQERLEFEKKHGVTMFSGIPVHEFKTPEGWHVRITGPHPEPELVAGDESAVEELWKPFKAFLEFYLVEDRPLCHKEIDGMTFEEVTHAAIDYSSDRSNIYNPDRMYIDGSWVMLEDVPQALKKWSEKRARQFQKDKLKYEAWLGQRKVDGE
jgi:hypothetical protein